jgi:hypothetical protein
MRNQKLIHPTRCSQLLSHRGVLVLVTVTLWEWEWDWDVVMQHIYIVKHDRATVRDTDIHFRLNYTFLSMIYISCRVGASCEPQRVVWRIRTSRIQLQNR